MYDESDEADDAATLLHASAKAPRQEHTAPLPSAKPPAVNPTAPTVPAFPLSPQNLAVAINANATTLPVPADASAPPLPPLNAPEPIVVRPREPIPFDRPAAPLPGALLGDDEPPPRVLVMPLVVGFLIFAIGLAFYIWAR
jgi:hypothetical protein